MSRRGHYGRRTSPNAAARSSRPAGAAAERSTAPAEELRAVGRPRPPGVPVEPPQATRAASEVPAATGPGESDRVIVTVPAEDREREHLSRSTMLQAGSTAPAPDVIGDVTSPAATRHQPGAPEARPTCTVAQLRRFIKSRPWVPMHELRRRFGIDGAEDDVTPIRVGGERLYIGLPPAEGRLMAELLGGGDVGYELSIDPDVPVVVGVYPMRPVPRG